MESIWSLLCAQHSHTSPRFAVVTAHFTSFWLRRFPTPTFYWNNSEQGCRDLSKQRAWYRMLYTSAKVTTFVLLLWLPWNLGSLCTPWPPHRCFTPLQDIQVCFVPGCSSLRLLSADSISHIPNFICMGSWRCKIRKLDLESIFKWIKILKQH